MKRFITAVLLAVASPAAAQDLSSLERSGIVAIMRHALAPDTPEGDVTFDIDDCATQRTLNEAGRDQARRIGAALRAAGIAFDHVWSSRYCRARETAELLNVGPVEEVAALDSFPEGQLRSPAQTEAVHERLAALPAGDRALLVTHQTNIAALTTRVTEAGEIVVALRKEAGAQDGSGEGDGQDGQEAPGPLEVFDRIHIAP